MFRQMDKLYPHFHKKKKPLPSAIRPKKKTKTSSPNHHWSIWNIWKNDFYSLNFPIRILLFFFFSPTTICLFLVIIYLVTCIFVLFHISILTDDKWNLYLFVYLREYFCMCFLSLFFSYTWWINQALRVFLFVSFPLYNK